MILTPPPSAARTRRYLVTRSMAVFSGLSLFAACSEPTCEETLTCRPPLAATEDGGELPSDGQVPLHDASSEAAEEDAAGNPEDAAGNPGDAGDAAPEDAALGPRIVSISPAPGAKGVRADANIVITFDRPMDRTKTAQAYVSSDVPAASATLTWNTQATQLTVNPTADLAYASGIVTTTPEAIAARSYSFRITTAARDAAGNPLNRDVTSSFTTLRRLAHGVVAKGPGAVGTIRNNDFVHECSENGGGYTAFRYMGPYKHKILVTFDISPFPAGIVSFERASVAANQMVVVEGSYGTGVVLIEHVREPFPLSEPHTAYDSPAVRALGVFSSNANLESKSASALDALADDYNARRRYSQYRLDNTFSAGAGFTYAKFDCFGVGFNLAAIYLVP